MHIYTLTYQCNNKYKFAIGPKPQRNMIIKIKIWRQRARERESETIDIQTHINCNVLRRIDGNFMRNALYFYAENQSINQHKL